MRTFYRRTQYTVQCTYSSMLYSTYIQNQYERWRRLTHYDSYEADEAKQPAINTVDSG